MYKNSYSKKKQDKVKKKRDSSQFELKIGTVPLKAGQLESMCIQRQSRSQTRPQIPAGNETTVQYIHQHVNVIPRVEKKSL